MPAQLPALFVRLPNHLGDACMCLPALDLLARTHALHLVGKHWAASLFEAYGWPLTAVDDFWPTVRALRAARQRAGSAPSGGVLFTNSFGTALQMRLAGISAAGYPTDARGPVLARRIPIPPAWSVDLHTVGYYYALAAALTGSDPKPPAALKLRLADRAQRGARSLLAAAGVDGPYIVLCPVAAGLHRGKVKAWSGFPQLCADLLARGHRVVSVPGPGERAAVQTALPGAAVLPETDVGTFAAVLAASRLVVANDSGPGHVAAAVQAPLVSVFGVTDPLRTTPWGPRVRRVGSGSGWPDYEAVVAAVDAALGG
jgi:heptosyltransferase-2